MWPDRTEIPVGTIASPIDCAPLDGAELFVVTHIATRLRKKLPPAGAACFQARVLLLRLLLLLLLLLLARLLLPLHCYCYYYYLYYKILILLSLTTNNTTNDSATTAINTTTTTLEKTTTRNTTTTIITNITTMIRPYKHKCCCHGHGAGLEETRRGMEKNLPS